MAERPVCTVVLPAITLGGRTIRFLTLCDNGQFSTFEWDEKVSGQPLFLGADVIAGIKQPSKNHPRIHARYAQDCLATKVQFPDMRLGGITNSGHLWFYSIQGLFQSVFEYQDLNVQQDCLLKLQEAWLQGYSDPPLLRKYEFRQSQHMLQSPQNHSLLCHPEAKESLQVVSEEVMMSEEGDPVVTLSGSCDVTLTSATQPPSSAREILERALSSAYELQNSNRIGAAEEAELSVLTQILKFAQVDLQHQMSEKNDCFPLSLLESYVNGVQNCDPDGLSSDFNVPPRKNVALKVVCEWLGKEFSHLETGINRKMEIFKKEHIYSLQNLPEAEVIVNELFPECMKILLCYWCGLGRQNLDGRPTDVENSHCLHGNMSADHSYSSLSKRGRAECQSKQIPQQTAHKDVDRKHIYRIIQLILEFACNNLLSGIAHVVYASLSQ